MITRYCIITVGRNNYGNVIGTGVLLIVHPSLILFFIQLFLATVAARARLDPVLSFWTTDNGRKKNLLEPA